MDCRRCLSLFHSSLAAMVCTAAPVVSTLAATAAVALASPAAAQGTSDLFPDPMSSSDMEASCERMGLTGDAKVAALKAFERYVEQFLALRKGDIDEYLTSRPPQASQLSAEELSARVAKRRTLLRRIDALENQLFQEIASGAGPSLGPSVERERTRAQRRRHWLAANPYLGRSSRVELSDLVENAILDVDLPNDTRASVLAVIRTYEDQHTALAQKLCDLAIEEPLAYAEARAAVPPMPRPEPGQGEPDPSLWRGYYEALEAARTKAREPQNEIRGKLRTLQRNTAKQLTGLLPEPAASTFHQLVLERVYPAIASPRDPVPSLLKDARDLAAKNDITSDELRSVEELSAQLTATRRQVDEQIMAALDKEPRAGGFGFSFAAIGEEEAPREQTPAEKLLEQRNRLDTSARDAIAATSPKLARSDAATADKQGPQVVINGATLDIGSITEEFSAGEGAAILIGGPEGDDFGGAAFIAVAGFDAAGLGSLGTAKPLDRTDLDRLRDDLKLAPDEMSILEMMYEDYRARWQEVEEAEYAELKALPPEFAMPGQPQATSADTARRFDLQRAVMDRVIALDRDFSEGLAAAFSARVSKRDAARFQRERERAAYLATDAARVGFVGGSVLGESRAATTDLRAVLRDAKLDDASRAAIDTRFDAWDAAAVDAFRARFETRFSAGREIAVIEDRLAEKSASEGGGREVRMTIDSGDKDFERMNVLGKQAAAADVLTRGLAESAIADMSAAIADTGERQSLLDAWDRKVWPSVFRDGRDISSHITRAEALEGLSTETRQQLALIVAEHRAEYRRISNEMIAANKKAEEESKANEATRDGIDIKALQARQDTQNRLRFERNELNEKSLRRIKELLTPEQSATVGDLPSKRTTPRGPQLRLPQAE